MRRRESGQTAHRTVQAEDLSRAEEREQDEPFRRFPWWARSLEG